MKPIKWLAEHLEEAVMVILLIVITFVCFIQVVIRKIPWIPALTWAEAETAQCSQHCGRRGDDSLYGTAGLLFR